MPGGPTAEAFQLWDSGQKGMQRKGQAISGRRGRGTCLLLGRGNCAQGQFYSSMTPQVVSGFPANHYALRERDQGLLNPQRATVFASPLIQACALEGNSTEWNRG